MKWIPYNPHKMPADNVFLKIKINGKEEVVIRNACVMLGNNIIAYMPLPKGFYEDASGWHTEFRSEVPPKDGWYVVQLVKSHTFSQPFWPNITNLKFIEKEQSWAHLSEDYNVIAWREFPKA
jgi:hypothetical protein